MMRWGRKNQILVLCYHNVGLQDGIRYRETRALTMSPSQFEHHLKWLTQFVDFISPGDFFKLEGRLPDRPVLMTFDDGTQGVLSHALPLLKKYHIKSVLFVAMKHHQSPQPYWWDLADQAHAPSSGISFLTDLLQLRSLGCEGARAKLLEKVSPEDIPMHLWPMAEEQLQKWVKAGQFLGSHGTIHDPAPAWLSDQESDPEWVKSLAEDQFFPAIAFPYGVEPQDITLYSRLSRQGYRAAFGTRSDLALFPHASLPAFALPRLIVPSQWSIPRLFSKMIRLSGASDRRNSYELTVSSV